MWIYTCCGELINADHLARIDIDVYEHSSRVTGHFEGGSPTIANVATEEMAEDVMLEIIQAIKDGKRFWSADGSIPA